MRAETAKLKPTTPSAEAISATEGLARHIIEFDVDDIATHGPHSLPVPELMRAPTRHPVPWPAGLAPVPTPTQGPPSPDQPLPQFDYVIVTWTVEEAKCLADTLTPGHPSKTDWHPYTHRFQDEYVPLIRKGAPALSSKRLGSWFSTRIGNKNVCCFKSELHMSQDGAKLPIAKLWRQLIEETKPKLIITTGTAGGIGGDVELGDVVVARHVRFDCQRTFKTRAFHASSYSCPTLGMTSFDKAAGLFAANADHLPASTRLPTIFCASRANGVASDVVTTDFFAFDDTNDTFHLQGLGTAVEMGDAVLGMVIEEMGQDAPRWAAVRNASDPQIPSAGLTEKEEAIKAAQIYERFGYWTTIPSAITCWALVVDN